MTTESKFWNLTKKEQKVQVILVSVAPRENIMMQGKKRLKWNSGREKHLK